MGSPGRMEQRAVTSSIGGTRVAAVVSTVAVWSSAFGAHECSASHADGKMPMHVELT